jgi:glycosyltransferase involved in cell wall biosynthesis
MHIIIFTHPAFVHSQSMPRYANMLAKGMQERGHSVELWTASACFSKLPVPGAFKKWMGYIDQFMLFPFVVRRKIKKEPEDTLFVFADQALGMWVPLVAHRRHIIHCHDFLAQRSALGEITENSVGRSGKCYQQLIRTGYRKGKNFISISYKTQADLHRFLEFIPACSEVVYNSLNQPFSPGNIMQVREELSQQLHLNLEKGYLLHVGNNSFYKNRKGVVEIYEAWRKLSQKKLPLLMIGSTPTKELLTQAQSSVYGKDIFFLENVTDNLLKSGYQGAALFLFPSLAEGFGWPIAEAMASGCPVLTTAEAPMSEVAGDAGFLIPCRPINGEASIEWATEAAAKVEEILSMNEAGRKEVIEKGLQNIDRFDTKKTMDQIEIIYSKVIL